MYLQKKYHKRAFSLIELLVVLFILSIATASFIPVMTRRGVLGSGANSSGDLWKKITSSDSIYYGMSDAQGAAIGTDDFGGHNTMLLIDSADKNQSQILTQIAGVNSGEINLDTEGNYAVGNNALSSITTGVLNTAFGKDTLRANTTGSWNSALGQYSLTANTTGGRNAAAGSYSMYSSISGSLNSILGDAGMAYGTTVTSNTGAGCAVFLNMLSGVGNTALGVRAMNHQNNAQYNTVIGWSALSHSLDVLHTMNYATAVGQSACQYTNGSYYNSCLGYQSGAIGPYALSIGSNAYAYATKSTAISGWTNDTNVLYLGHSDADYLYRMPGKFKIGTVNAGSGTALFSNAGIVSISSDSRLKNIVEPFNFGLEKIRELKPYNYNFKNEDAKHIRVNVVAQDLQKIFPNSVKKDDEGYLMIQKEEMFYAMVNSIKQLDKIAENLISKIHDLLIRVQNLENQMVALVKVEKIHQSEISNLELSNKKLDEGLKKLEKKISKEKSEMQ